MFKSISTLLFVAFGSLVLMGPPSLMAGLGISTASAVNAPPGAVSASAPTPARFAGTYVSDTHYVDFITGQLRDFQLLTSIHADGTLTSSDTDDFDPLAGGGIDGTLYGSWRATGSHSTTQTGLFYVYDANGQAIYTVRSDWNVNVLSFQTGSVSGAGEVRIYFPGMDPLDKSVGTLVGSYTFTASRLDV